MGKYYLTVICNEMYHDSLINFIQVNTLTSNYFYFNKYIGTGVFQFNCSTDGLSDYSVYFSIKQLMHDLTSEIKHFEYTLTRDLLIPTLTK